ncbi:DNA repair protein XRCC3 isoform X1 [Lutra lutra]|uniref:DNA repair protein XRCC3 isoform X1 n=1 Tax=Lutra lutra TaxID=9657 RepID=UPI001FD3246A|nr:DNA repair protein XRCC3 isoform X1 [Lutra lutra]XP_047593169.1 DNA repair protein XRCC3 isoform X1 [Lutra lutra]XP_047593170.1 DNA repair protein XRCC3 isoform X1 [Lutra lutra]XP_047593171.1 DNA repair protein XRCC3 isoform X1 [Lutra lutra]
MDLDQLDLNPRIIAAVKKAKLKSAKEVLHYSGPDLQRLTRLSSLDVQQLLRTASSCLRGCGVFTALHLYRQNQSCPARSQRLSLGCPVLDGLLRGGLPSDGLTELAGPSSAGKTQLALQLCLTVQFPRRHGGLESGAVYICTEDVFPDPRLQQLIAQQRRLRTDVPGDVVDRMKFGDHIFIEHVADVDALLECVRKKVPVLLSRGMARLVVIDSVAAPFRCEFDGAASVPRARRLQALGGALRWLSCTFRSPVLCVNQVGARPAPRTTDSLSRWFRGDAGWGEAVGSLQQLTPVCTFQVTEATEEQGAAPGPQSPWDERVSPALGMTWSHQLLMRLMASRHRLEDGGRAAPGRPDRTLRVIFAPHLPPSSCSYTVNAEGVRGTPGTESC